MSTPELDPNFALMLDDLQPVHQGASPTPQAPQYLSPGGGANTQPPAPQPERWLNIPAALRQRAQWCIAGTDKSPWTVDGRRASSTDPTTWSDFDSACSAARVRGLHIGYMLREGDPFTCIDIDVNDSTTQEHIARFQKIVEAADSYAERSQSGRGLHIWVEGSIGDGCKRDGVEVYSQDRFMICTGDTYKNRPIEERSWLLETLVSEMRHGRASVEPLPDGPELESDNVILERARSAANADKFNAHYAGAFDAIGHNDHSRADMALLQMLAHYTRNNGQLKRLFLSSKLGQRDKAVKRGDYLDRTIHRVRSMEAAGPNVAHGERVAATIISNAFVKLLGSKTSQGGEGCKFRLVSEEEMANRPPVRWRVRGIVPEEGVVAVYGPPGSGKSFLVLDMLGAIATGRDWFGHKARRAPVIYAALEGKAGVSQRVRAYRARRGRMNEVKFIDVPIDLRRPDDRDAIIRTITEAGLHNGVLCIDTLAASAPGMDENTSTDMGEMIAALQEIQGALGGVVLVVHHTGKDQTRGLRGWSGLTGALDGAIEVLRADEGRKWKVAKAKDGADGESMPFELEVVLLDVDEDGMPITSCVVVQGDHGTAQEDATEKVLALMREYYERGEYIATAYNSPNSAFKILKDDAQYPQGLPGKTLTTLLREAEREGLIEREKFRDQYRNERERWRVL